MSERAMVSVPSGASSFTTFNSRCAPGGPTGITMIQHLLAELHVDVRGHAAHHVRPRYRHAIADVQVGVVVAAPEIPREHEFLARHQQEGALVAVVDRVP